MSDDLDQLMSVMAAAFDPHWREAWTRRQVEDALLLPSTFALLAGRDGLALVEGEVAVAFVLARRVVDEAELLLIAVAPEARGQGIGRRLLARFEEAARAAGARKVFLEMRSNNPAEELYRSAGYTPIGRRPSYYRTGSGELLDAVTFGKSCEI